jgi:hypothetical protein
MEKLLEKFQEDLSKYSIKNPLQCGPSDLKEVIELHKNIIDAAMNKKALHPYQKLLNSIFDTLNNVYNAINSEKLEILLRKLNVDIPRSEFSLMKSILAEAVENFGNSARIFDLMGKSIEEKITIEMLPNVGGETLYFTKAKIVLKSNNNGKTGHYVFAFDRSKCPCCDKMEIIVGEENIVPEKTIESAIKNHIDPKVLQTVIIARNTEEYPLKETALPVVIKKYLPYIK